MIVASFQNQQNNSHRLLLPWVWEQEELHLVFYGNLSTSTGCISIPLCHSSEWRCLSGVLLFLEHCGSASDCCAAHTNHAHVWLSHTINEFHRLTMVRSLELKLLSVGSMFITDSLLVVRWLYAGGVEYKCQLMAPLQENFLLGRNQRFCIH